MQSNTLVIVITAVVYITDSDSQCHQPTQTSADNQSMLLQARRHSFFSVQQSKSLKKKKNEWKILQQNKRQQVRKDNTIVMIILDNEKHANLCPRYGKFSDDVDTLLLFMC